MKAAKRTAGAAGAAPSTSWPEGHPGKERLQIAGRTERDWKVNSPQKIRKRQEEQQPKEAYRANRTTKVPRIPSRIKDARAMSR